MFPHMNREGKNTNSIIQRQMLDMKIADNNILSPAYTNKWEPQLALKDTVRTVCTDNPPDLDGALFAEGVDNESFNMVRKLF